jgi:ribonuclease P protein component
LSLRGEGRRGEKSSLSPMKRNLTREERLKKKSDFDNVFATGMRKGCSGARIVFRQNGLDYSRFAVCPVRKYGNSVNRNRVKRVFREIYRLNKNRIKPGFDIVLVAYPGKDTYKAREGQFCFLFNEEKLFTVDMN